MRIPFVWRRTADADVQVWKDRTAYWRRRAESSEDSLAAEVTARRRATELFSDLFDEHERVTTRNALLCAQVEDKTAGFDQEKARRAAERIARLQRGVARARQEAAAQKRRADRLQARLDDAVGLGAGRIKDSRPWQPGYKTAKADAS